MSSIPSLNIKPGRVLLAAILLVTTIPIPLMSSGHSRQARQRQLLHAAAINKWPAKSKRFALIIGVDEYDDSQVSKLEGAANDARALADALVRYSGFPEDQVTLLASDQPLERRPTRGNILRRLSNLRGLVPQDGLLLVSFAGHGIERGGRGFLCPTDAQISGDMALLEATAIPVETVREWIRQTGVKQVVIILDACRNDPSGRGESENPLTESYARQFNFDVRNGEVNAFATFYATNVGSIAYEYKEKKQGYFTWALVDGIKGAAANEKGEVTLAGLKRYLEEIVPKRVALDLGQEKRQRPSAAIEGYKADELVISVTARILLAASETAARVDPAAIELGFWQSIQTSTDAKDFQEYLKKYPEGQFAGLARNRLDRLRVVSESEPGVPKPGPSASVAPASSTGTAVDKWKEIRRNATSAGGLGTGPGGIPLMSYEFDTVKVDSRGTVVEQRKGQARYFVEDLGGGVTLEVAAVPGGTFVMGSPAFSEANRSLDEGPQHEVSVPGFYAGKFEVTQAQWRAVARMPKVTRYLDPDPSHFKGGELPVEQVSWDDVREFCARLWGKTGLSYRLPSEAEWEYACRAGTATPFAFGETIAPGLVNYNGFPYSIAAKEAYRERTTRVGSLDRANGFGLYDMHGNVWEWCMDVWHSNYAGAPSDGSAWVTGGDQSYRVVRGGSWDGYPNGTRSAFRNRYHPDNRSYNGGFRVVVVART
jgi:formylglycine-generating enzyme required for sulfatase activity